MEVQVLYVKGVYSHNKGEIGKMGKDPAFLFYPGDWLGGTQLFSRSHKGAYMDVLMAQFMNGHMVLEDIKYLLGSDFEIMWESKLKSKFKIDSKGKYYNERLDFEKNRRKEYTDGRKDNLNKKPSHMDDHMDTHMENENINRNSKGNKGGMGGKEGKKKQAVKYPTLAEMEEYFLENGFGLELAKKVFKYYSEADWFDTNGKKVLNWKQKVQAVWFKEENKVKEKDTIPYELHYPR